MPEVTLTIESTHLTVRRPVIQSVATDVMANFGLGTTFSLHYSGTDDPEDLTITDTNLRQGSGFFENTKIVLTSDVEYVENSRSATVHRLHENKPIFSDKELGVLIAPNYARVKCNLSFNIRCNDKNAALALKSRIRQLFQIDQRSIVHDVKYKYIVPAKVESLLTEIYTLRERVEPYGETQDEYYGKHFFDDVDIVTNLNGSGKALAVNEMQNRIIGDYDFEIAPDKPEVTDGKRYVLNFTYTFEYDEPLSLNVMYPLIVHNQLINNSFFDNTIPYEYAMIPSRASSTVSALDYYTSNNKLTEQFKGVPVPNITDWIPKHHQRDLFGIARLIIIVEKENPRNVINLLDMDDVELNKESIEFIKNNRSLATTYRRSPIYFSLYEGDTKVPDDALTIKEDLTIVTDFDMSLRKRYFLWIAVFEDLATMGSKDIEVLREYPTFTENVLLSLAPELSLPDTKTGKDNQLPSKRQDGILVKKELEEVLLKIHQKRVPRRLDLDYSRRNVGFYLIKAMRNE